jgi:hypothetical protein
MDQVRALPFWDKHHKKLAVSIVGSVGAGLDDEYSDIDVYVLLRESDSMAIYEVCKHGYKTGSVDVLNPRAFQLDEFPMLKLRDLHGHINPIVFESIETNVRSFNDVERWICLNSITLHDPARMAASLKSEAAVYPFQILNRKLIRHRWMVHDFLWSTKVPLERGQKKAVSLLCANGISNLLKLCILNEGNPYPYDKWLYDVAIQTPLGELTRQYVDLLFEEIHRPNIVVEVPDQYAEPEGRNVEYERFRIYHIILALLQTIDSNLPKRQKDNDALSDRIGAWKPRK